MTASIKERLFTRQGALFITLLLFALLLNFKFLVSFVAPGLDLYLALMAIPLCLVIEQKGVFSSRYGIISLALGIGYVLLQVQTLYFLSIISLIIFFIEMSFGKLNRTSFLIAVLISPVSHYLLNVFSFPIRLKITALAGNLLSIFIDNVLVAGNIIKLGERSYEVESACLGLNMMVTGAILCLTIMAFFNHKLQQSTKQRDFALWAVLASVLLIISNLLRIIILVLFDITPDNIAHDITGLISLAFYVLLPLWFLTPKFIKGAHFKASTVKTSLNIKISAIPVLVTLLLLAGSQRFNEFKAESQNLNYNLPNGLKGFNKSTPYADVFKFSNEESVVFYKPCKSYYNSTHTPTICWRGSGLKLKNEKHQIVNGNTILTATLTNDSLTLHTAWWYQSKGNITVDQMEWRYDAFKNKSRYTLVNVSAFEEARLQSMLKDYFLK
ncbi:MAG: exosortase N [Bacteroidia bacterium]